MQKADVKTTLNLNNFEDFVTPYTLGLVLKNKIECPCPVGFCMISTVATEPSTLYPGTTWTQVSDGYYLLSATSGAGSTVGSSTSGSTTLTANQSGLRFHAHTLPGHTFNWGATAPSNNVFQNVGDAQGGSTPGNAFYTSQGNWNQTNANGGWDAAEGHTHSIQPPGFKVYVWLRTK